MENLINQENLEAIMEFLHDNLNYAILLNEKEIKEITLFFQNKMNWDKFKKTLIEIKNIEGKGYFTIKKNDEYLNNYIITDELISTHRIVTLKDIINRLKPYVKNVSLDYCEPLFELVTTSNGITYENINKKENEEDMLKILEIYKDKKVKEIEEKYDKKIEELIKNDPVNIFIEQAEETVKTMLNSKNVKVYLNSDVGEITSETIEKQNEIVDIIMEEKNKLNTKIKEISALLELAPNYEEKIKILRDYEIVDKKKNIIL